MASFDRNAWNALERRHFVLGAAALLLAAVFLAKYHIAHINERYATGIRINVNTADESLLALLPQIGAERARRIVEYRTSHGRFQSTSQLLLVEGIGPETLNLILSQVKVED